jgi:hypothetical protein
MELRMRDSPLDTHSQLMWNLPTASRAAASGVASLPPSALLPSPHFVGPSLPPSMAFDSSSIDRLFPPSVQQHEEVQQHLPADLRAQLDLFPNHDIAKSNDGPD